MVELLLCEMTMILLSVADGAASRGHHCCQLAALMLPTSGRVVAKCVGVCYKWRCRLGTRSGGASLLPEVSAAATRHAIACDKGIFLSTNFGLVDLHHRFKISATIVLLIFINGRIFFLCLFYKFASMEEFFATNIL
jgi:hypothetical protein